MTDQSCDGIRYGSAGYDLLGAEPGLFSPHDHGIEPHSVCSSNWSGWIAGYEVVDERLFLRTLYVGQRPRSRRPSSDPELDSLLGFGGSEPVLPPLLNGVAPQPFSGGYVHYPDIGLPLHYSGVLTLGEAGPDGVDTPRWVLIFADGVLRSVKEPTT